MKYTYIDGLNELNVEHLKKFQSLLKLHDRPTRKAEIVDSIHRYVMSSKLNIIWNELSVDEKNILREAVFDPGNRVVDRQYKAKYGKLPKYLKRNSSWSSKPHQATVLDVLLVNDPSRWHKNRIVAADLKERLLQFIEPPKQIQLKTTKSLPETVKNWEFGEESLTCCNRELTVQYELAAILNLIKDGKILVSEKTLRPTLASQKKIAAKLVDGDFYEKEQDIPPIRAFAWPMIFQAAKLANRQGTRLKLTRSGSAALSKPFEETIRMLWKGWLNHSIFDEFSRINLIKGQTRGRGKRALTTALHRRWIVDDVLEACPTGEWISVDDLSNFLQAEGHEFPITDDPWTLYINHPEYGSLGYAGFHGWEMLEQPYLFCLLFEYAATLGLIDVAYTLPNGSRFEYHRHNNPELYDLSFLSYYDGLQFIRLNALGEYCLNGIEKYVPSRQPDSSDLRLLPNLRIQGTLQPHELLVLELYADTESENVWRLNRIKCIEALEDGRPHDELRAFLQIRDKQPMPETMEGFLRKFESAAYALKPAGRAVIFECVDEKLANQIANHELTKKYCKTVYKNQISVTVRSEKAFRDAVHQVGFGFAERKN